MENCPFCGSKMQVAMKNAILCLECYASGPQAEDRKAAWNTRADTAAWNTAIQAAADAMLPTIIDFRGSWYEPALKAARGRILALLKP